MVPNGYFIVTFGHIDGEIKRLFAKQGMALPLYTDMLFGTIFGVIIVPGLYFIFGSLADGRKLIKDEDDSSLSDDFVHQIDNFENNEENE